MPVKVHGNMTILSVRVYCFCYMIRYVVRNVGLYSVDHGFILFFVIRFGSIRFQYGLVLFGLIWFVLALIVLDRTRERHEKKYG